MIKATPASKNAMLNSIGLKEQLDDGFLYIFSGTLPDTAEEALDMVSDHTELLKVSVDGDGSTGLTFETPSGGVLSKTVAEDWTGECTFDGFEDAETTLTPTFFRFCAAGDTGRTLADSSTGYRLQGTVGGPGSGADLMLGVDDLTAGNDQPIGAATITIA